MGTEMVILVFIVGSYLALAVLWGFYLAVMNLKRNKEYLTPASKTWAYPIIGIGYVLDALITIIPATLYFGLDIPREWTLSERLTRYKNGNPGWKMRHAVWFCENMLNPFAPDKVHC